MSGAAGSESTEATLRRLEELHAELGALIASLRVGEMAPSAPQEISAADGPGPAADAPPAADEDLAGLRLIALNMALGGTPREQTARFLAENYSVADPERLLDEVYASAGA